MATSASAGDAQRGACKSAPETDDPLSGSSSAAKPKLGRKNGDGFRNAPTRKTLSLIFFLRRPPAAILAMATLTQTLHDIKWSTASIIFTPAKLQAGVGDAYRRFRPREAPITSWTVAGVTDSRRLAPNGTARSCPTSNGERRAGSLHLPTCRRATVTPTGDYAPGRHRWRPGRWQV